MLLYSAIALFALAVICIILYVLMTKKIIRVDKRVIDIKVLRKITGIASAVLVIAAGVLTVIYIRSNLALFKKLDGCQLQTDTEHLDQKDTADKQQNGTGKVLRTRSAEP